MARSHSSCRRSGGSPARSFHAIILTIILLLPVCVAAATLPTNFSETTFASGLTNATAMAFSPDGRLFVCEQGGQLRVVKNGALLAAPFVSLTVDSNGERGLLGVAVDPNFAVNNFIYLYYTATTPTTHNRVSRFTADVGAGGDVVLAGSEVSILELDNLSGATNHNGGAIHFGPDGKLYVAVGENANGANSQSIANRLGKMLRINSDGTIPIDNPTSFPGILGNTSSVNRAIWSVGLRNPYTFAFQPGTGRMFINDVGQSTWEEINDGIAGSNYGWSTCEGSCSNVNFRDPLFQYGHGGGPTLGCAITGGTFYNPTTTLFPASYVGKYFYGELCNGWIRLFDSGTGTSSAFATGVSQPLDMIVQSDGSLYYLARGTGTVMRVSYSSPTAAGVSISGRVLTPEGRGLRNAVVNLTDQNGSTRTIRTGSLGTYRFDDVPVGATYIMWVDSRQYRFTPREIALADELRDVDLVAQSARMKASVIRIRDSSTRGRRAP